MEAAGHAQALGDAVRLVHAAGAGAADIHLLQADDVRRLGGDHRGDAPDVQTPVGPQAAVHVVAEQTDQSALP